MIVLVFFYVEYLSIVHKSKIPVFVNTFIQQLAQIIGKYLKVLSYKTEKIIENLQLFSLFLQFSLILLIPNTRKRSHRISNF